jgi:SAM-dependent methyltransferase
MNGSFRKLMRAWVLPFVDPRQVASLRLLPRFLLEFREYRRLHGGGRTRLGDTYPCLTDRVAKTPFDPHYFYQGAWLARRLRKSAPALHVDAGSSVLMVSVLSAQVPTWFVDYRPLQADLPGLRSIAGSVTALPFADNSVESLSSLHVIEHIGLGRYGDPLDPAGSINAARELQRVLKPGGHLYLSVPVGRERVCFNAHRVFEPRSIARYLGSLELLEFSVVDDAGCFAEEGDLDKAATLDYGCGMFEFTKRSGNA